MIPSKLLLILVLFSITKCNLCAENKNYALNSVLKHTSHFFEKLKMDHVNLKDSQTDMRTIIGEKVAQHVKNELSFNRHKREYENSNKGIMVLDGFQDFSKLNFNEVQDIKFFYLQDELEIVWFTVILDSSTVFVYQINNQMFYKVGTYPLINGTQIIVNSCTYGALLIIHNENESVLILSFTKVLGQFYLQPIYNQDFELKNTTHLTSWNGMNQLYLAIASHLSISIFAWFGNYFDLIQVINIGTDKLVPFQSKGFMHLAVTGSTTFIFKYFLRSNEFLIVQRLPASRNACSFQVRDGHFVEDFLTLSTESSTIIYKEIYDRFVPFQQIPSGKFAVPIVANKAIVLLSLREDTLVSYQYDGWKFIKLNVKLFGISQFHPVMLHGKELILVKNKNDRWTMKQPLWIRKKSYKDLQEELRLWNIDVKNKIQKTVVETPNLKGPIKILRGHINQLRTYKINDHNSQKLKNVTKQYKELASRLKEQKIIMNKKWNPKNLTFASLYAKKLQVKCKTNCKASQLNVKGNTKLRSKLIASRDENQTLYLKNMNVKQVKNWKCPLLGLLIKDITVSKLINNISLSYLQENSLKVSGDQVVSGEHIFTNVNAISVSMPLNIATNITYQKLIMKEVKVKELNLTAGGILLPLNGSSTTITGSIKTPELKASRIRQQGKITGKLKKKSSPVIYISESMTFNGDFAIENVVTENLKAFDLIANKTGSITDTLSNVISLKDNVPVSLILTSEKMKWSNVTLYGPLNWITTKSKNTIVSGKKHFPCKIEITKFSYDNLRIPQIQANLCAVSIIAPEIKLSVLTAGNITVKSLTSSQVFGNLGERYLTDNSTAFFRPVLSKELHYWNVTAKNVTATQLNNLNLTELKWILSLWAAPNIVNGSIEATVLVTNNLRTPIHLNMKLPKVIKNIIVEQDVRINNINGINFSDFLTNAIKLEDMISLQNITFSNGFSTDHIHAFHLPFYMMDRKEDLNFHRKRISGNVEAAAIYLPHSFEIAQDENPLNIIVKGSLNFPQEPTITNVNNVELNKLLGEIWLTSDDTEFWGRNMHFENVVMKDSITLKDLASTLSPKIWKNISTRILSRTKPQKIKVHASLNEVNVPDIIGSSKSIIRSSLSEFSNIFENSLLKNRNQTVKAKWAFETLKVLGKLFLEGKINNMNLKTDVIRHDSEKNIVNGKKTVIVLIVENLNGNNFSEWVNNALTQKTEHVIFKGRKKFSTASFKDITVSGTVMGHTIEETLTKSTNQTVYGQKKIRGSVNATELTINGLVNDVNLTKLMDYQLKKHKPLQIVEIGITLQNSLNIFGNLKVRGAYGGVEMKSFYKNYSNIQPIVKRMKSTLNAAEIINTALRNRAVYINKLEVVKDTISTSNKSTAVQAMQCKSTNFSSHCIRESRMNFNFQTNTSDFILLKLILMNRKEFLVLIKLDVVSIFLLDNTGNNLVHLKDLHIPNITDAFVEPKGHSLWIILQLPSQTLVLHHQPWKDLQEYVLPATNVFAMSKSPNNQLLLLLSDGVWDLDGLTSPRNIIRIPLAGTVETFVDKFNYYVKCNSKTDTALMKVRYVGN